MIKQKRDLHDTDRGDVMYAIGCLCGLMALSAVWSSLVKEKNPCL